MKAYLSLLAGVCLRMWKDLQNEKKVSGPSDVITSLDPSQNLNWAKSSYNPSKLLGYGTTYGGESGVGNPCEGLKRCSDVVERTSYFLYF